MDDPVSNFLQTNGGERRSYERLGNQALNLDKLCLSVSDRERFSGRARFSSDYVIGNIVVDATFTTL